VVLVEVEFELEWSAASEGIAVEVERVATARKPLLLGFGVQWILSIVKLLAHFCVWNEKGYM
jgi:hypothetical protein